MDKKENVEIIDIENELKNLWQSHSHANKSKACLFNLIVYTHEARRALYFKKMVQTIMEKFPCRVIFIQADKDSSSRYLRARVFTEGSDSANSMLCDQILIETTDHYLQRVPFLILPNLISDLPIYLLWGQDPTTENAILPHLQKFATRLIFDSECANNLHRFSQMMINLLASSKIEIMDLNWARIGGWRKALAQTFDNKQRIQQLSTCKQVKIVYNNRPDPFFFHAETQALYLQAWLAAQLGWQFKRMEKKDNKTTLFYHFHDKPIKIILQPQERDDIPPEEALALEFSGDNDYLCNLSRRTDDQVVVNYYTHYQCELPFTLVLSNIRSARNLMQEVFFQRPSEQYKHMLQLVSRIEGAGNGKS